MGRYRTPNATTRKRRNIEGRLAREAKLDDLSRGGTVEDYHWGTDPGHGGLTKHRGPVDGCASPDADSCIPA